jgi:hypothetical protein
VTLAAAQYEIPFKLSISEMDFGAGPTFNIILKGGALDPQPHDVSVPIYRLRQPRHRRSSETD